ncbi:MAG: PAS domain S-box protein [Candidatus Omnitrophica bacterium]|nr:PAS domain S-box protein [Candidatus Omnitrophota bacterium]
MNQSLQMFVRLNLRSSIVLLLWWIFAAAPLVPISQTSAEDYQPLPTWDFRLYKTPDGDILPRSRDIAEDREGGIWVATWGGGLHYFDRTVWRDFTERDGLPGDWTRCVEVDAKGRVWVGTGDGLARIDRGQVEILSCSEELGVPLDDIYLIERMKDDSIWVSDNRGNLVSFNESEPPAWRMVLSATATSGNRINSLATEADGTIWVCLRDQNLLSFDGEEWTPSTPFEGQAWLGVGPRFSEPDSLLCFNNFDTPIYRREGDGWVPFPECGRRVFTIARSPGGDYFAGTDYGVYRFVDGKWNLLYLGREVGRPEVDVLLFAKDGSLWIGTREGLVRGYLPYWTREIGSKRGVGLSTILLSDPDSHTVYGIDSENFLVKKDGADWSRIAPFEVPSDQVVHWTTLRDGAFWMLIDKGGNRFQFDLAKVSVESGQILEREEISDLGPDLRVFQTSKGRLWLLSTNGVLEKREGRWTPIPEDSDYRRRRVYSALETEPGVVYLGLEDGFEIWRNGEVEFFGEEKGLDPSDAVQVILQRDNGDVWFGSYGSGIYVYDGTRVHTIDEDDGLLSNSVSCLHQSRDGTIWIAYRWIGAAFEKEGRWVNFSHNEGLPNNPVTLIEEGPQGEIFLSTLREGVFKYQMESDPPETRIDAGPDQTGPHGIGVFTFRGWDAWNKTPVSDLLYSWRVFPLREANRPHSWSAFENTTFTATDDLYPGKYVIEVRASDRQGNVDPSPVSKEFFVAPPFFTNPFFWGPIILLLFTVAAGWFLRKRSHQRLLRTHESLRASEERFRILVEQASDAFFVHDFDGNILEVNQRACDTLGYRREELLRLNVRDLDPEVSLEKFRTAWRRISQNLEEAATVETRHRRKDGTTFPVEVRFGPFKSDGASLILSLARDITERQKAEEALKERERLYREAIEIAGAVPYFQLYEPDSYSFVGKGITELTGLSPEEFTNHRFAELIEETIFYGDLKDLEPEEAVRKVKTEENLIWKADYRIRTKDGREKWLSNAAVMVRAKDGAVQGSLGIIQDITEEKLHQEEALRRLERVSEQQTALKELATLGGSSEIDTSDIFRRITEVACQVLEVEQAGIWLFDKDYEKIRCIDFFRTGKSTHTFGQTIEAEDHPNYFRSLLSDRVIDASDAASDPRTAEFREEYLPRYRISSMLDAPIHVAGRVVGVVCLEHVGEKRRWAPEEISFAGGLADCAALNIVNEEREEIRNALEFSEERFRSFVEHSSEAIFCFEFTPPIPSHLGEREQAREMANRAVLVECNDRFAHAYGGRFASDLLGKKYLELTTWGSEKIDMFNRFVSNGYRVVEGETQEKGGDGEIRHILTSAHGVVEEGCLVRVWGIDRDVTQRKNVELELERYRNHLEDLVRERTEELEQVHQELVKKERLATLGQLIASVSHELRNPLGTIRGTFYMLKERVLGDNLDLDKPFDRIERNILRCDRIIEELLDFTRIQRVELEETDLDRFLSEFLEEYQLPKTIQLRTYFESGKTLPLDREKFRRCLINILGNAADAMLKNSNLDSPGVLSVTSRVENGRIEVIVEDTGEGVSPEILEKITEPLFSTKGFGIGLGVPIAIQIMESHQGGVEYESEVGKGTRAILWFPSEKTPIPSRQ